MRGRRQAGIAAFVVFLGLAAGCDSAGTDARATPTVPVPSGTAAPVTPGATAPAEPGEESRPAWTPSLKPEADTLYLGQGELPNSVIDRTTASASGKLVIRVECQGGRFTSTVEVARKTREASFDCDGRRQEKDLGAVAKGQDLAMHHSGDPGVRFAVELVVVAGG